MPKKIPKKIIDKPITKEDLGLMLHKYINPLYEKVDKLERDMGEVKRDLQGVKREVENVKGIQLRMENSLVDDNKLLHDRDDAHDKKLQEHDKRISSIEKTTVRAIS